MTAQDLFAGLERVIRLILEYPRGLSILLGAAPPPSALELILYFPPKSFDSLGIHSSQRPYEERIVEMSDLHGHVIAQAGGWGHITKSVCGWKLFNRSDWDMIADHVKSVRLNIIADRYGVSARTVIRKRRAFPGILAEFILFSEIEDGLGV